MIDNPIVFDPTFNEIGARLIPVVNSYANSLNSFHNDYDVALQVLLLLSWIWVPILLTCAYCMTQTTGENLWPGWEYCNDWDPHGKWHQVCLP